VKQTFCRDMAFLGGTIVFCATMLLGLLQSKLPLKAALNAAMCTVPFTIVLWIAIIVGKSVLVQALRENQGDDEL